MIILSKINIKNGIDISIKHVWYGLHFYWQQDPLFDIIISHTKNNTVHKYGIIIFGFWMYVRIDGIKKG